MPAVASPPVDDDDIGDDAPAKRRPWGPEEDEHLRSLVDVYGIKSWAQIATNLSNRNGKQCRERWRNHLRPQLNKGDWSAEEDCAIWDRVQEMGTKWAQISELYMPQRTDNDIKNRWNSIIRKTQHPSGREWTAEENDARAAILGSASRAQGGARVKPSGEEGEEGAGVGSARPAPAPRERKRQRTVGSGGVVNGTSSALGSASGVATMGDPAKVGVVGLGGKHDDISPDGPQARKLFESPEAVPFEGRDAVGVGGTSADDDDDVRLSEVVESGTGGNLSEEAKGAADGDEVLPPSDAAEACRMLVGGEISSDTFDVDAFLPLAAASMGSLSQMNSPMGDGKAPGRAPSRFAQDWFDPELDSSLSPILTPSLRHQLRALMASKSPTPKPNASAAQGSSGAAGANSASAISSSPPAAPYSATSLLAAEMSSVSKASHSSRRPGTRSASKEAADAAATTPGGSAATPVGTATGHGSGSASGGRMCLASALSAALAASSSTVSSLTSALSAAAGAAAASSPVPAANANGKAPATTTA